MPPKAFRPAPFKRHPQYEERLGQVLAMRDAGCTHKQIAKELGVSRQRVTQLLALSSDRNVS